MFEKLRRYRLKKNPSGYYAQRQMDKAAKKAGFTLAASRGRPYYVDEMQPNNIKCAVRVRHYLHCRCDRTDIYNEACCVVLFSGGVIESMIHEIGECLHCHYLYHPTPLVVLRIKEKRNMLHRRNRHGWWGTKIRI
jgi:hypothetical protein